MRRPTRQETRPEDLRRTEGSHWQGLGGPENPLRHARMECKSEVIYSNCLKTGFVRILDIRKVSGFQIFFENQ